MRIEREWFGGSEVIDLDNPVGYYHFHHNVVQDQEIADELIERIRDEGEVIVNPDDPEFYERYTRLDHIYDVVDLPIPDFGPVDELGVVTIEHPRTDDDAVLIAGNPVDGFSFYGPFNSRQAAIEWGERSGYGDWWTARLWSTAPYPRGEP